MRSDLVALIIFGSIPFIFRLPVVGLYVYSWISYMNPHRLTWGFAYDFPFAATIGALTFVAWLISREPKKLPIMPTTVLMLFFTLWITLSTIFAINVDAAFVKWMQVIKIFAMTFLMIVIVCDRRRLDAMTWVIVGSIGFFAVKGGIFSALTGGAYRVYGPPQSMITDNNALALATIMVVPFVFYLRNTVTNRWIRRGILACIPVMIFSVLASYSRGALLAMVAMGAFLWLKSRHKLATSFLIVAIAAAGISFMPQKWFHRMDTIARYQKDESAEGRLNAWAMGLNLALDHPILGGGFTVYETVPWVWSKYAPVPENRHAAHSIYFEVLGYDGFIGLFAFLTIGFLAFFNCRKVIRGVKGRPDLLWCRDLAAMIQVSLVGFATGGAFLNLAFFDLFWNIVALSVANRIVFERLVASSVKHASLSTAQPIRTFVRTDPVVGRPTTSFLRNSR